MKDFQRRGGVLIVVAFNTLFLAHADTGSKPCTDSDGKVIPHGEDFIPDFNDACKICTCDNGYPILCRTNTCLPPPDCEKTKPIPRECCQFICEDGDGKNSLPPSLDHNTTFNGKPASDEDNITNLSLRLVASTVTSFLVLALLLFMVHRLRQRRLMLAMRRFEAHARQEGRSEDDLDHYIPAAFLHIECPPYEDPPPPYSPPKPPPILPEESPPPYQEVENDTADLDANANVSNNNNNNDQSCIQHRQDNRANSTETGRDVDRCFSSNIIDVFSGCSESTPVDSNSSSGARSSASASGREDETELNLISRRESCLFERSPPLFREDYSLFVGGTGRSSSTMSCDHNMEKGLASNEATTVQDGRQKNDHSYRAGNQVGSQNARKTWRSCSFSVPRQPDEDISMSGVVLAPMSHSYHAATADSGVQTHGSYTASLSHHRCRPSNTNGDHIKSTLKEKIECSPEQRMLTKPMAKCDAAVQQSHRLLQEELRRNLPPAFTGTGETQQDAAFCPQPDPTGSKPGNSFPDLDVGVPLSSPNHGGLASSQLPRSQSVNSTFSVCSETGEVRLRKALAEAECSVLQNDSQYPEHSAPRSSPACPMPTSRQPQADLGYNDSPSSLSDYTFPISAVHFPNRVALPCSSLGDSRVTHAKTAATTASIRRPVPNPPSQELRTGACAPNSRLHSAKLKHKKIHFVPLEKSKTFKSKKDKGKGSKKGEADQVLRPDSGARPVPSHSCSTSVPETSEARVHQPKLGDIMRNRLAGLQSQSVKQYGFLENFAQEEGYLDSACRNQDTEQQSGGGSGLNLHLYHSLPHKSHGHCSTASHHPAGHRRQFSYGDKPHAGVSTLRSKNKSRPLSGGLVVEIRRDPVSFTPALPQGSITRRRLKTPHQKKCRQSCPNPDSGQAMDRKMNCLDLGLIEPSHEQVRTVCSDLEVVPHTLPGKRYAMDRTCDKAAAGGVDGQMSSYV